MTQTLSSQKVSLYSINDLKNATDDALAPYLTELPAPYNFRQSFSHIDTRLAVGYFAVVVSAVTFYADWKLGWDATKDYLIGACGLYFVLNSLLTFWIWKVEAGEVFVGVRQGGQKLTLRSATQKHTPLYKLKVRYEAPSGKKWEDKEIEGQFTQWFNEDGYLQHKQLQRWLASNIEVVGMAEGENRKKAEKLFSGDGVSATAVAKSPQTPAIPASDGEARKRTKKKP